MSRRGATKMNPVLKVVTGTYRKDKNGGLTQEQAKKAHRKESEAFGPAECPEHFDLDPFAKEAWDKYIKPAWWINKSHEPLAIAFCELWSVFRANPKSFSAASYTSMRTLSNAIGLTDARNRTIEQEDDEDDLFS